MLSAGQEVNTKYGVGVVVSAGTANPQVFVRILANSKIYILDGADVIAAVPQQRNAGIPDRPSHPAHGDEARWGAEQELEPAAPGLSGSFDSGWRGQMKRGQIEGRRRVEETPLSIFVGARLAALGMKQSEFCRLTGFDQGLLSKIQSSMISKLNLETALRLAVGLSVPPGRIFGLIGRKDLNDLIAKAYPNRPEVIGIEADEPPAQLVEIGQMAARAHSQGRNLTPVIDLLAELVATPLEQSHSQGG
jgi:transcriptional regulator with XRE-family HTH domain